MTEDNLSEFLNERVLATRQVHHIQYPLELAGPAVGVMLDCPEDAMTVVLLPTFVKNLLHLEIHCFVDGERRQPILGQQFPPNTDIELMLTRDHPPTTLSHSKEDDEN